MIFGKHEPPRVNQLVPMLRLQCAWCGCVTRHGTGSLTSFGICGPCRTTLVAAYAARRATT